MQHLLQQVGGELLAGRWPSHDVDPALLDQVGEEHTDHPDRQPDGGRYISHGRRRAAQPENPAVLGAEVGRVTGPFCPPGCQTRNHWLSTVRGRLGYAFDRILPYVTAGLAVGDINATLPGFPGGSVTSAGWTVGAGIEYAVVGNVSVKAEYLFVSLSDFNCGLNCGLVGNGNVSFYSNIGRLGLNVHF